MASIRRRANGWSVLWREDDGKQRSKLFTDQKEARKFKRDIEDGSADASTGTAWARMSFGQFVREQYLPNSGLALSTRRGHEAALRRDLAPLAGKTVGWVCMHRAEVQAIIAASDRVDHGALYSLAKMAADEAVNLGAVPAHRLGGLSVRRNTVRRDIILTTHAQRKHIADGLDTMKYRGRPAHRGLVVWLMTGTGCRIGEALALHGSDFRDSYRTVRFQRKAWKGSPGPLKARKDGQFRDVPVPGWLAGMVRAYVSDHGLGPLFPGTSGKPYLSYEAVGIKVGELAAEVGLEGFTCHQFRHGYATTLLSAGEQLENVAKWMGDGYRVVEETYHHVMPVAEDRAREILDQAWQDDGEAAEPAA